MANATSSPSAKLESMKTSAIGRRFIEGLEGTRLKPYRDAVGVWTIGCGHTRYAAALADLGFELTEQQVGLLLDYDLKSVEQALGLYLPTLTQNQFDALASLVFNIGVGAFLSSTLLRLLKNGDMTGAADQFLVWNKAAGRVLPGLADRRKAERTLFLTP